MDSEVLLLRVIEPISSLHFEIIEAGFDWEKYEKDLMAQAERKAKSYLK